MIRRIAAAVLGVVLVLRALPASTAGYDARARLASDIYPLFIVAGPDGNL